MAERKVPVHGLTHLRVTLSEDLYIGPGRADLLELIDRTGSISAAGRAMRMSYRRAWMLVQALNHGFGAPLVTTTRGGSGQGGAQLTELGATVLATYRRMQESAAAAITDDVQALRALISHAPKE